MLLPEEKLVSGASRLGTDLSSNQIEQINIFAEMLVERNKTLNLTGIIEPDKIVTEHILDSLTVFAATNIPNNAKLADIGCGAGLPGMILKIIREDIDLTLVDSTKKKLVFLDEVIAKLNIKGAKTLAMRAEEMGKDKTYREKFDLTCARAVANMKVLSELCLPLVKIGGIVIAMKTDKANEEIACAKPIIGQLGGKITKVKTIDIPFTDETRKLFIISKLKPTPKRFPRDYKLMIK